jgi:hypothetical protein
MYLLLHHNIIREADIPCTPSSQVNIKSSQQLNESLVGIIYIQLIKQ